MSAEQVSLFGELDGLFAPDLLPTTPADEVQLIPGDHVEAMRVANPGPCPPPCERPTDAERAYLASIEHAETAAPDADADHAWANAFTPAEELTAPDPWTCIDCGRGCTFHDARMTADGPWCENCDTDPDTRTNDTRSMNP